VRKFIHLIEAGPHNSIILMVGKGRVFNIIPPTPPPPSLSLLLLLPVAYREGGFGGVQTLPEIPKF
jgi:hypothetical protein